MTLVNNSKPSTPFGFWIWCGGAAPGSNGGYRNDCQGSMYFYALALPAMHVIGQATESAPGIFTMLVAEGTDGSTAPSTFHCALTNVTPGGGDKVSVSCMFTDSLGGGMGSATVTGAIVNITGP